MELWDLAAVVLNARVGRPERGCNDIPSISEQLAVRTTTVERMAFCNLASAFLKSQAMEVDQVKLKQEVFSVASTILDE